MLDLRECLFVTFTYDHASGVQYANLSNGARFAVEGIPGKLGNALQLHRRAVVELNSGKYVQAKGSKNELRYSYNEEQVRRFTTSGLPDVTLPELELDLADLEL